MKENEKKVKICDFGKALGIEDIIESVTYSKGDRNNKGDQPGDHVIITLRDGKEIIKDALKKAFSAHYKTVSVEAYAGEEWVEYNVLFKDGKVDGVPIIGDEEREIIEKYNLRIKSVYKESIILDEEKT